MKLYRIEELIDQHNKNEILILDIKDNENKSLLKTKYTEEDRNVVSVFKGDVIYNELINNIDNYKDIIMKNMKFMPSKIEQDIDKINIYRLFPSKALGSLSYDRYTVIYEYMGNTERIYDTNHIGNIEYANLSFNLGDSEEVEVLPIPPIDNSDNYKHDNPYSNGIVNPPSYLENDIIYPGNLDNYLYYDASLGKLYRNDDSIFDGSYKKSSGYDRYFGNGYVNIEDGYLEMNIHVPDDGYYFMNVGNGTSYNTSIVNKLFIDKVGRYTRSKVDTKYLWNLSAVESFNDVSDEYEKSNIYKFKEGTHHILFEYDSEFSTMNNDIDGIFLQKVTNLKPINEIYTRDNKFKKIHNRYVMNMDEFYSDNDSINQGTSINSESEIIEGKRKEINEVKSFSNNFTKMTGSFKAKINNIENDTYTLSVLHRYSNTNNNIGNRISLVIDGKNYILFNDDYREGINKFSLYKYNPLIGTYSKYEKVYLENGMEINITVPDNNDILFDSLVICSENNFEHSDVNKKAITYPNINNMYLLPQHHFRINEKNELLRMDDINKSLSFNSISEYIIDENRFYKINKSPITYAIDNFDFNSKKLTFDVNYKNEDIEISKNIKSYYLPKLLLCNLNNEFGRYIKYKPYIFQSLKYESYMDNFDTEKVSYSKYDSKIIPLENYSNEDVSVYDENISDIVIDYGEDWKDYLLNNIKSLDDITFTLIYKS